jgi:hypothetical protein
MHTPHSIAARSANRKASKASKAVLGIIAKQVYERIWLSIAGARLGGNRRDSCSFLRACVRWEDGRWAAGQRRRHVNGVGGFDYDLLSMSQGGGWRALVLIRR